jgi:predicted CDP-diglyceride synthetase/phosphatidate cytidylyltransferase
MLENASQWLQQLPDIDWALVTAVALAALVSLLYGRRGGRFRELPGWSGFWVLFAALLIALSRVTPRWISFALLAAWMFTSLRSYFSVSPVRPRDRLAVLATYLSIPVTLWPAYIGSHETFLATVPVSLFLFIPVFLSIGYQQEGFLDSMGRTLLGVLFFVFCVGYLGLLVHEQPPGLLELFGILVLGAELPQRLLGRFRPGAGWLKPTTGIVLSLFLTAAIGFWLGPWCGLVEEDAARAGFLVAVAVTLGASVGSAVAQDLAQTQSSAWFGRGAFLNRMVPAVYAAPVYFHYLNHFA